MNTIWPQEPTKAMEAYMDPEAVESARRVCALYDAAERCPRNLRGPAVAAVIYAHVATRMGGRHFDAWLKRTWGPK